MADYCICGSLKINNCCTNSKCRFSSSKKKPAKKAAVTKFYRRKSSKIITCGIEDLNKKGSE